MYTRLRVRERTPHNDEFPSLSRSIQSNPQPLAPLRPLSPVLTQTHTSSQPNALKASLVNLLANLQATELLQKPSTTPKYHKFFLPDLAVLLNPPRSQTLHYLRAAYTNFQQLYALSSAMVSSEERVMYHSFAKKFGCALANAEMVCRGAGTGAGRGEEAELKAVSPIIDAVAGLCHLEWGLDPRQFLEPLTIPLSESLVGQQHSATVPSPYDELHVATSLNHETNPFSFSNQPQTTDNTSLFPTVTHYIRSNGRVINPAACMQQQGTGCSVPFTVRLSSRHEYEGGNSSYASVLYPDKTILPYLPLLKIRLLNEMPKRSRHIVPIPTARMARLQMSGLMYDCMVQMSVQAYRSAHGEPKKGFVKDWKNTPLDIGIFPMEVSADAFVRIMEKDRIHELPFWQALDMCGHDLDGIGLFRMAFLERDDGVKVSAEAAGFVVQRNLINYWERIFDVLDSE